MKNLVIAVLLLGFSVGSFVHADKDMSGTYVGCGQYNGIGKRAVIFTLLRQPTGFDAGQAKYTAGLIWQGISKTFFPDVQVSQDLAHYLMKVDIVPRADYGMIVKTVRVDILADGSIEGLYYSNSMDQNGFVATGFFKAVRTADGQTNFVVNCTL